MDPSTHVRPSRLGATQPSLLPNAKHIAMPRAPRAALADVSNRDPAQLHAPHYPSQKDALPVRRRTVDSRPLEPLEPVALPSEPAAVHDVSMQAPSARVHPTVYISDDAPPEHTGIALSRSTETLASDDSDALAVLELDIDPTGLLTLSLDEELEAQQRVAEICAEYERRVLAPLALAAQAERHEMVQHGQLDAACAEHDDEMMQLGLDPEEARDASMVAEYASEIFEYMACCERDSLANPSYMDFQDEIQWHMRTTLIDWLLQVHTRYHLLPETLWIAVNLVDRFLSARIVSLAKLQLVGVTAMFIAAKYEEILAPSVEEFVFMTENGYSREEILKGERIVLSTLDFNVSTYCSPYSWVRRISKADDYEIQTRTLCKFLMEATLLNHHFVRARPSLIAAIGMYLAKRMLGGVWDDAFVYYSHFTEEQLLPGTSLLLEKLIEPGFEEQFVYKKYGSKKFLKASIYARNWALRNHHEFDASPPGSTASSAYAEAR